jgi:hypothetical protein
MPLIRIENWPTEGILIDDHWVGRPSQAVIRSWKRDLAKAIAAATISSEIPGVGAGDVTVVFGGEQVLMGDSTLIVWVDGLFSNVSRTNKIKIDFANNLCTAALEFLTSGWKVEAVVTRFLTGIDICKVVTKIEWVISYRNGTFFQNPEADKGGPMNTAERFISEKDANKYIAANEWMLNYEPLPVALEASPEL